MKILSIETSCDETAISIVEASGKIESPSFVVLGNALFSQIDIHKEYGGVYPMMAKREHAKNLPLILKKVLEQSSLYNEAKEICSEDVFLEIKTILSRENELYESFRELFGKVSKPSIDVISVTSGPGLAPALWVGITFAKALEKLWDIPLIGANHMEGHITSILIENTDSRIVQFPALALLISGGHTELVFVENWGKYKVIGQTRDDAVGEAFDKVARMIKLPYPGGPEVSRLAEYARENNLPHIAVFPRPMLHSHDLDFSFSGLKTAVLYYIRDNFINERLMTQDVKADISREFEDSIIDVLLHKTNEAIENFETKTLIIGGGVIANKRIRETFMALEDKHNGLIVKVPTKALATDNSLMIAAATYLNISLNPEILSSQNGIVADGNLKLGELKKE